MKIAFLRVLASMKTRVAVECVLPAHQVDLHALARADWLDDIVDVYLRVGAGNTGLVDDDGGGVVLRRHFDSDDDEPAARASLHLAAEMVQTLSRR